jgi:CBS-domain-containing membrane protein
MLCEEVMHRDVAFVSPDDSIEAAAQTMRDEDVGFLPVIDEQRHVVGTVTDRDLVVRALAVGNFDAKCKDVMSSEVVGCQPTDDLRRAEQLMSEHKIVRLVMLDDVGRLLGVISFSDLAGWEGDERRVLGMLRDVKEQQEPAQF